MIGRVYVYVGCMEKKITMSDDEQTVICNRLREFLQSIALQAVQAQDCIGADKCIDLLYDIEQDVDVAQKLAAKLVESF